jgi:outer membrane lipoprotein-sorting protein
MRSLAIFLAAAALHTIARADSLDAIFARMDEASRNFRSVSANIHETKYTAVLSEKSEEDSKLIAKRTKNEIRGKLEFFGPDARTLVFNSKVAEMYWPKANQAQSFDISKYPKVLDQLLLLSFGAASGAEIKRDYNVSLGGTEKLAGKTVTRVDLVPKSADLKKLMSRITLWIPEGEASAVQEKVDQPSKDYVLWTYSDVKMNGNVADSMIELKLPSGVKRIGPK